MSIKRFAHAILLLSALVIGPLAAIPFSSSLHFPLSKSQLTQHPYTRNERTP
jgi:hypothetical protein